MKIGLDIDGIILDFERTMRVYAELYDLLILRKNGVKNSNEIDNTDKNYLYKISDNITDVLKCISDIDTENIFDWTYHVEDSDKVLNPTAADSF